MDYLAVLQGMVIRLLDRTWTVSEFHDHFYMFFVDEVPDNVLSDTDFSFFCEIHEKLDWTAEAPDSASRSDGWIDEVAYLNWIRKIYASYMKGEWSDRCRWGSAEETE